VPAYFYEAAAKLPERTNLENIRRGQFEGLREDLKRNLDRQPDIGEPKLHPTAGTTVVGARKFLIAYNVNLATNDLQIAKDIAKVTREKGGGLPSVKALGFSLEDKGIVQVSMNLTDFTVTGMLTAFNHVKQEAETRGVQVLGSELVGLVPLDALAQVAREALQLDAFSSKQVVEVQLASREND